jgi:N-acetylneuraminate synthase
LGISVPVAAIAVGATIIEKHLTLRRADGGPDGGFSLEPNELGEMVRAIRVAEQALGHVRYGPTEHEVGSRILRRSLFVVEAIAAGERFTEGNVRSIRPGHGLHPRHRSDILGKTAARDIQRGEPLTWELIADLQ